MLREFANHEVWRETVDSAIISHRTADGVYGKDTPAQIRFEDKLYNLEMLKGIPLNPVLQVANESLRFAGLKPEFGFAANVNDGIYANHKTCQPENLVVEGVTYALKFVC